MLCCGSGGIRSSARLLKAAQVKGAYLLDFPRTELSKRNLILHLYQAIILEKEVLEKSTSLPQSTGMIAIPLQRKEHESAQERKRTK